jgi:NADH-quinone oxidoreductase subunit J
MTSMQIVFIVGAAVTLLSALMVVTRRNLVHAALYLILTLFGVAMLFVLLEAGFLAVVQVLVYIGAIAILMIFAVMLTRRVAGEDGSKFNKNYGFAIALAIMVFSSLVVMLSGWSQFYAEAPQIDTGDSVEALGQVLFSAGAYVIPSLVASVLLLAALLGAVVIAWQRGKVGE